MSKKFPDKYGFNFNKIFLPSSNRTDLKNYLTNRIFSHLDDSSNGCLITFGSSDSGKGKIFLFLFQYLKKDSTIYGTLN